MANAALTLKARSQPAAVVTISAPLMNLLPCCRWLRCWDSWVAQSLLLPCTRSAACSLPAVAQAAWSAWTSTWTTSGSLDYWQQSREA